MNDDEMRLLIPRDRSCADRARRFVNHSLRDLASTDARHDAALITSELVTNAYQHGKGKIELKLGVTNGQLLIEVADEGRGTVAIRDAKAPNDPLSGGWGLQIVDQLANEWGTCDGPTHVWARMRLG